MIDSIKFLYNQERKEKQMSEIKYYTLREKSKLKEKIAKCMGDLPVKGSVFGRSIGRMNCNENRDRETHHTVN